MTLIIVRASESAHWYEKTGKPAYTVEAKSGERRATTLRDARKFGFIPSVTTVMQAAAKPGLDSWKLQQAIYAALTLPRVEGETEQNFVDRVVLDSKETAKNAAERGTAVHTAIERAFEGLPYDQSLKTHVEGYDEALKIHFGTRDWQCETAFGHPMGFGGKVDMHTDGILVDAKTKEFGPDKVWKAVDYYDEHVMQLAAYREGVEMPTARCANIFVSVTHPGLVHVHEWTEEELQRGWNCFQSLLSYWKFKNRYLENT